MRVEEIRDEAGLRDLRPAWDILLQATPAATTFQTWQWAAAWWSAYGKAGELRVLAALDDKGVLRGIAPLRRHEAHRYGLTPPALSFVGDGSNDSDYLDFILAFGYELRVMQAFNGYLAQELSRGTVLRLNEIPEQSSTLSLLADVCSQGKLIWQQADVPCGSVHLPDTWEDYLAMLRPRFRSKIRSTLRNLETRPEVRFAICQTREQLGSLLSVLFDLHTRRWAKDGKPGVFGSDQKRKFYSQLSPLLLERGWLRLTWLQWKEHILACQYGFVSGSTYFQLQEGYEPDAEHWNPGTALRAWSIGQFIKEGIREYDFLGGMGRHKEAWGARLKYSKRVSVGQARLRNIVFCRGPEWGTRLREALRRVTPDRILAARHAYLERQFWSGRTQNASTYSGTPVPESWVLKAVANVYVNSPGPTLMRPLRERYRFFISHKKKWPQILMEGRSESSGRILGYHRVNDECDPFLPATPVNAFERQIQFVARYYRVVSLAELLKRLDECEPVGHTVAITFDDGYRDNYEYAFPILRHYGLPATIFLTTGSIDDCQPLWFESLAAALKETDHEFADLEIDLPRRFWLRTREERLNANERIYALLRGLPDAARRSAYQEVLRELVTGHCLIPNHTMLSWDQIREMRQNGISFGGHTVTHPFLSKMSPDDAAWEVTESKRRIESELQCPVEHFAYPSGRQQDFAAWNKELLRSAGYSAAVTTIWGVNSRSSDRLELRRGQPWEADPALFGWKLDWYSLVNG